MAKLNPNLYRRHLLLGALQGTSLLVLGGCEEIMKKVRPTAAAKYIVFRCTDTDSDGNNYFESIDLIDAVHPQTILAYELNDQPLPVDNGAPLRLRVETQLGYKHAKYIRRLELVASLEKIRQGKGGVWADQGYEGYAGV